MHIFLTGGTGWIGPSLIAHLLTHNHTITALARTRTSASALRDLGTTPLLGDLEDHDSLRRGAESADAIIHLAFVLDLSDFHKGAVLEEAALRTMGEAIRGTGKALVYASGTMMLPKGKLGYEDDAVDLNSPFSVRAAGDTLMKEMSRTAGIRGIAVRLPPTVHGKGDKWQVAMMVAAARRNGEVVVVGEGKQRWPAVHREDAVEVFRLAVEKGRAGATYHAVAEEGVRLQDVGEVIGRKLGVEVVGREGEEAKGKLGFLAFSMAMDNPVSSEKTRRELDWEPVQLGLLADVEANYFED